MRCRWFLVALVVGAASPVATAEPKPETAPVDFNRDVLPILTANCFACHGPDEKARKADLRLDEEAAAKAVIVSGQPAKSSLIARITADDADGRMPPPKHAARLKPEQVVILRAWVEQGAAFSDHWAFAPPRKPEIPKTKHPSTNPIDAFVLSRLEKKGLKPVPRAPREVLIRRVTLDLTGLPPTPEEIDAFLKDNTPSAWEKVVDRLLASPHYGERWGRHWLDVARYADSGGFETDIFYASAWRYRDYVIRSFNADKPFDLFIKEQIAGDELFPGNRDALVATSLYAVGPVLEEAKMVPGKLDDDWLTDAVDTTGSAFLGLTVGCARCHDHKYDPFSQKDYYAIQAAFAGSDLFDFKPDGTVLRERVALTKREKEFEEARKKADPKKQPSDYDEYPELPLRGLAHRTKTIEVRLLNRGELAHPGDVVKPALPTRLAKGEAMTSEKSRSVLAEWVAGSRNPLTARVIANRVWQWHFGEGLVRTPNDFGVRGERPTHPELLDWLAVEFVESKWSVKKLHRRILLSDTYQMASTADTETLRLDPENRLLTRFQPRRVEAEVVWDSIRLAAGTLNQKMYGLPVIPPLDARELIGNYRKWSASSPEEANRRAVYVVVRRSFQFPAFGPFDPPENVSSCGRRDSTVVPTQALALLNNRSVREQAGAFAARLLRETDGSFEAIANRAWLHVYGRAITKDERSEVVEFLKAVEKSLAGTPDTKRLAIQELCIALFNTSEFIYLP